MLAHTTLKVIRFDQQVKSKQHYVPKFNLGTMEENVNLHTKVINIVNIADGNESKTSSLEGDIVAKSCWKQDSLE